MIANISKRSISEATDVFEKLIAGGYVSWMDQAGVVEVIAKALDDAWEDGYNSSSFIERMNSCSLTEFW